MDLQALINEAAQNKDWLLLAVGCVALAVPIVLKAMGKNIPVVDQVLDVLIRVAVNFRKKPVPPPVAGKEGISAVVPIEDKKKEP
jgi:hypothetical protein